MSAIEIPNNQIAGIKYTWRTGDSSDWTDVPGDTYFFDIATQKVYYKNSANKVLDILKDKGSSYYGQVFYTGGGTVTGLTGGAYKSTGLTATLDTNASFGISLGTTDGLAVKNTSGETLIYKIYASADIDGGTNKILSIRLALNGTTIPETQCNASTGTGSNFAKLVTNWMISLAPNDEVALWVANLTDDSNLQVDRSRLVAISINK